METKTGNQGQGNTPERNSAGMNRAKAKAVGLEKRLREVATWELTQGNRLKTNPDAIFEMARNFRHQIDVGLWKNLDELETTVFSHWALGANFGQDPMVFSDVDPASGG